MTGKLVTSWRCPVPTAKRVKSPEVDLQERVLYALRHPRGRYVADRASQLSGVPKSTLYDWRSTKVHVPDFDGDSPVAWSYRDLVYLRLLAWLRQVGMERPVATKHVAGLKSHIAAGDEVRYLRANRHTVLFDNETTSRFDGQNLLPFEHLASLLSTFDLLEPVDELRQRGRHRLWAPDLVNPSHHTFISPWVLAGDPCVQRTRIPTSAVYALRTERGLGDAAVAALYPGLSTEAAADAYELERRLRGEETPEPVAA